MLLGVLGFTAGTSFLTTLLDNYDSSNKGNQQRQIMLNNVYKRYGLPLKIFERVKKSFNHRLKEANQELVDFINQLPNDLKLEVSMFIHENTYK